MPARAFSSSTTSTRPAAGAEATTGMSMPPVSPRSAFREHGSAVRERIFVKS
jgi:hypothetical protein